MTNRVDFQDVLEQMNDAQSFIWELSAYDRIGQEKVLVQKYMEEEPDGEESLALLEKNVERLGKQPGKTFSITFRKSAKGASASNYGPFEFRITPSVQEQRLGQLLPGEIMQQGYMPNAMVEQYQKIFSDRQQLQFDKFQQDIEFNDKLRKLEEREKEVEEKRKEFTELEKEYKDNKKMWGDIFEDQLGKVLKTFSGNEETGLGKVKEEEEELTESERTVAELSQYIYENVAEDQLQKFSDAVKTMIQKFNAYSNSQDEIRTETEERRERADTVTDQS